MGRLGQGRPVTLLLPASLELAELLCRHLRDELVVVEASVTSHVGSDNALMRRQAGRGAAILARGQPVLGLCQKDGPQKLQPVRDGGGNVERG